MISMQSIAFRPCKRTTRHRLRTMLFSHEPSPLGGVLLFSNPSIPPGQRLPGRGPPLPRPRRVLRRQRRDPVHLVKRHRRVQIAQHVVDRPLRLDEFHPVVYELARVVAADVHSHDLPGLLVEDQFQESVGREDESAEALGVERHSLSGVDSHFFALLRGEAVVGSLGGGPYADGEGEGVGCKGFGVEVFARHADFSDLARRTAIRAILRLVVILLIDGIVITNYPILLYQILRKHVLNGSVPLRHPRTRQERPSQNISRRVNIPPVRIRLQPRIDLDTAVTVRLYARPGQVEVGRVGLSSDRGDVDVALDVGGGRGGTGSASLGLEVEDDGGLDVALGYVELFDLGASFDFDAASYQISHERRSNILIQPDLHQRIPRYIIPYNQRNVAPQILKYLRKLDRDNPAPRNRHALGQVTQRINRIAIEHSLPVERNPPRSEGRAARGDEYFCGGEGGDGLIVAVGDEEGGGSAAVGEGGVALDVGYAGVFELTDGVAGVEGG
mmetsp:Transcript_11406/g.21592  ORF Transcript_11406/g.21592 Transcript_11406/m.21592 type:complete len:500 (-) Transcript_11406:523-2022(-)